MALSVSLWMTAAGVLVLGLVGWFVYEWYLHPAWRKERRVIRACEKAFDEGTYQLERLHTSFEEPSGADLLSPTIFGVGEPPRYFTYKIKVAERAEPDFSGMSRKEIGLVRRYLRHRPDVPHYGKKVLYPQANEFFANNHSGASA